MRERERCRRRREWHYLKTYILEQFFWNITRFIYFSVTQVHRTTLKTDDLLFVQYSDGGAPIWWYKTDELGDYFPVCGLNAMMFVLVHRTQKQACFYFKVHFRRLRIIKINEMLWTSFWWNSVLSCIMYRSIDNTKQQNVRI